MNSWFKINYLKKRVAGIDATRSSLKCTESNGPYSYTQTPNSGTTGISKPPIQEAVSVGLSPDWIAERPANEFSILRNLDLGHQPPSPFPFFPFLILHYAPDFGLAQHLQAWEFEG